MEQLNLYTPALPKAKSNKGYILYKLLGGHQIDNKQMKAEIDTCYAGSRISELRSDGWPIGDKPIPTLNGEKKEVCIKKYFIGRDKIADFLKYKEVQDFFDRAEQIYNH